MRGFRRKETFKSGGAFPRDPRHSEGCGISCRRVLRCEIVISFDRNQPPRVHGVARSGRASAGSVPRATDGRALWAARWRPFPGREEGWPAVSLARREIAVFACLVDAVHMFVEKQW